MTSQRITKNDSVVTALRDDYGAFVRETIYSGLRLLSTRNYDLSGRPYTPTGCVSTIDERRRDEQESALRVCFYCQGTTRKSSPCEYCGRPERKR